MTDNLVIASSFSGTQLDEAYQEMLTKLTGEMTIKQVLSFMADLSATTVIMYTHAGSYVFCSNDNSSTRNMLKTLQDNLRSPEKLRNFLESTRTSHCQTQYSGIYLDCYDKTASAALSADLVSGEEVIGTLCLLDVDKRSFSVQAETLQLFCKILTSKIASSYVLLSESTEAVAKDVNAEVNSGAIWLRKIKGDQFQNFYIAAINAQDISAVEVERIKHSITQNGLLSRLVMHIPYVTILFNLRYNEEIAVMRKVLEQLCSELGVSIGLSCRFRSTERIHNCYQQALEALRTSENLGNANTLCDFNILCANVLLSELNRTGDLACYRNEALDRLNEYDVVNGTKYFETLKAFITCGGSKQNASQKLYIHRNSLSYRLKCIEDILDINLDDITVQTKLWFDIKITETLDAEC